MHPQWQAIATRLERARKAMAEPAALHRDKANVRAAEAASLGISVLGEDATTGVLNLGVFKMPSIPEDIMQPPKGRNSVVTPSVCVWKASPHSPTSCTSVPPCVCILCVSLTCTKL